LEHTYGMHVIFFRFTGRLSLTGYQKTWSDLSASLMLEVGDLSASDMTLSFIY